MIYEHLKPLFGIHTCNIYKSLNGAPFDHCFIVFLFVYIIVVPIDNCIDIIGYMS